MRRTLDDLDLDLLGLKIGSDEQGSVISEKEDYTLTVEKRSKC